MGQLIHDRHLGGRCKTAAGFPAYLRLHFHFLNIIPSGTFERGASSEFNTKKIKGSVGEAHNTVFTRLTTLIKFLDLYGGVGGHLFEAGYLLTFSAFRMGASFRWALIRINTVIDNNYCYTYKKNFNSIGT